MPGIMPIVSPFLKSRLTNKNLLAFTVKDEEEGGLNQRLIWRRKVGFKKYFVQEGGDVYIPKDVYLWICIYG